MFTLSDCVGETIFLRPKVKFRPEDRSGLYAVILHGVESGGIWVEHPTLTEIVASSVGKKPSDFPKQTLFFFPYSEIEHIVNFATKLDPESLGL
jgi:hypothetical protein